MTLPYTLAPSMRILIGNVWERKMKPLGWLLIWIGMGSAQAGEAVIDFDRNWIFPQSLGGLDYVISEKYEVKDLGYRILYRSGEPFEAEVTLLDLGYESIPTGCKGAGVDVILQRTNETLALRTDRGEIEGVKKMTSRVVAKKGLLQFASVVFAYTALEEPEKKKLQATYVTGFKNTLIVLRFTFDREHASKATPMAHQMMLQLTQLATAEPSADRLLMASCSVFLNDPYSYGGLSSAQYLMAKATETGDLNVYPELFAWPTGYWGKPKNADLLVAAYFAGMLQVIVPQHLDEGGEVEGFSAMLDTYQTLRAKEQIKVIAQFDKWVQSSDRKALFEQILTVE